MMGHGFSTYRRPISGATLLLLLVVALFLAPASALAATPTYPCGSYGSGGYDSACANTTTPNSSAGGSSANTPSDSTTSSGSTAPVPSATSGPAGSPLPTTVKTKAPKAGWRLYVFLAILLLGIGLFVFLLVKRRRRKNNQQLQG